MLTSFSFSFADWKKREKRRKGMSEGWKEGSEGGRKKAGKEGRKEEESRERRKEGKSKEEWVNLVFWMVWMSEKGCHGELTKLVCSPLLHMTPESPASKGIEAKFNFVQWNGRVEGGIDLGSTMLTLVVCMQAGLVLHGLGITVQKSFLKLQARNKAVPDPESCPEVICKSCFPSVIWQRMTGPPLTHYLDDVVKENLIKYILGGKSWVGECHAGTQLPLPT